MHRFNSLLAPSALALLLTAAAPSAQAAVFQVTKSADSADGACNQDCSLREAVLAANAADGSDVIVLGVGVHYLSIIGTDEDQAATGDLDILDDVSILGRDAANTFIDGFYGDRVFDVPAGRKLELINVAVLHGDASPGGAVRVAGELVTNRSMIFFSRSNLGGAIHGQGTGSSIRLVQSTVEYNDAVNGGGISSEGRVDLINSTLSHNEASGSGGGLYASSRSYGTVSNTTITENTAVVKGGGVFVGSEPFISVDHPAFKNSIIAANSPGADGDCSGSALSAGHNLLGIGGVNGAGCLDFGTSHSDLVGTASAPLNPRLDGLIPTGGSTNAHAPLPASPAIDHGSGCEELDQRGAVRGAICDIGSIEVNQQCISGGTTLCLQRNRFKVEVAWTSNDSGSGNAYATSLTNDSGYFWFFEASNVELTVKVLDACGLNHKYWVFMSGMTNVGVTVTVTDLATGAVRVYANPRNRTFVTVTDTSAFDCP